MSKPWFDQYDPGTPHEIDADRFPNVVELLLQAGERFADKVAFSNFGATKTYADILNLSRDFAAWLQNEAGVKKGDRIAMMMPNTLVFPARSDVLAMCV